MDKHQGKLMLCMCVVYGPWCMHSVLGAGSAFLAPYRLIMLGFALLCFSHQFIFPKISLIL